MKYQYKVWEDNSGYSYSVRLLLDDAGNFEPVGTGHAETSMEADRRAREVANTAQLGRESRARKEAAPWVDA